MSITVDRDTLHRTAKYFMDGGRVATHDEATALLQGFGLTIHVGKEIADSLQHQIALLTLVNVARRTLLGGIEIVGVPDVPCLTLLAAGQSLQQAVCELGGRLAALARPDWPSAVIGSASEVNIAAPSWRLTWEGWSGGVIPNREHTRLADDDAVALSPALAAGICAAEVFAWHAGDHPMAGLRAAGLSLWHPGTDWCSGEEVGPAVSNLPSRLWLIGLGNLGQAYAWLLACLPFRDPSQVQLMLQDFDTIAVSNESTSILSFPKDLRCKKTRAIAQWLDARGFETSLEERRFGEWTQRAGHEPAVALFGVDNANARAALEKSGFGLIVESGLGAGPQGFRNISMHTFPASRSAESLWLKSVNTPIENFESMPAYQALKKEGVDGCGLTQLASRTVGVPFVGLIAACLVISELLRRLNGGKALEMVSLSVGALEDVETATISAQLYQFGHVQR